MGMTDDSKKHSDPSMGMEKYIEVAARIGLVGLLVVWSLLIIKPFIQPVLWGVIIAIGFYPLHQKLASILGNRKKLSAALLTFFSLAILIGPVALLTDSSVGGIQTLNRKIENGTLTVPPPSDKVAEWPVIGKPIDRLWRQASENMDKTIQRLLPSIKKYGPKILSAFMSVGLTIVQFIISILIAGVLLVNAEAGERVTQTFLNRVAGEQGETLTILAGATIRSVVQGVLGIAVIQSLLAGAGLVAVGVPFAGFWALMVLFMAIIQLPPLLILGPIVLYVFSTHEITPAIIFMIWSFLVSISDSFLKPLLLGRGVDVPMLVVLLGAIGGMIMSGIIGLFVGSVILSISYKLFIAWINNDPHQLQPSAPLAPENE
jgi:predicted PurR-regulated permease PerM